MTDFIDGEFFLFFMDKASEISWLFFIAGGYRLKGARALSPLEIQAVCAAFVRRVSSLFGIRNIGGNSG